MNTSIHTTSRLSGRVGVPALYTTAHRAHISHTLSVPHVLAPCAASTTNDTPAPIVSAVSHAARRAPPPRRTTMDKIGTRITTTIAFAHRQRSAPRRATKRQPIHATGASLSIIRSLQHSSFGTLRQHARNGNIQSLTDLSVTAAGGRHRTRGSAATHLRRLPRRAVCLR